MSLLLSDSLVVVTKFLQVLLWISIPALFIGMLITTVIHYSNKRKKAGKNEEPFIFEDDGSCSGFDDISLVPPGFYSTGSKQEIKRLLLHLSHSNARYIAVRKDFERLTEKYQQLREKNEHYSEIKKYKTMETIHTNTQQSHDEQLHNIRQLHEIEKKELLSELNQLNTAYEDLEKDNSKLQEQLAAYSSDETNVTAIIQKWEQEKAELKKKISEHEYLKDVLEEKKLQINFLQQQLEQRVKNHHLVELQFRELGIKLMETTEQLEIADQTGKDYQAAVHEKEQEIIVLKEVKQSSTESVARMETTIKELQEQHSKFTVEIEEKNNSINDLQAQLAASNEIRSTLEEKLKRDQSLFKGFHRKLSDLLEEDNTESPVIALKPIYKQENAVEQVTESAIQ